MSTYTVPAGVDVPSEVGATIHLAVPGEPIARPVEVWGVYGPPPVLAALVQKKCETCEGDGIGDRCYVGAEAHCDACAGSGFDLLDLVRECRANHLIDSHEPLCDESGRISLGRWKVEALDADDQGGYVATLTLVVAP